MPSLGLVHADALDIRPPDFGRKNTGCEVREAVESKPKPCTKPSRRSQNATGNKLRNEQGAQAFHCRAEHPMMILEVPQMPTTSEHTSKPYLQSIPRVALAVFHITVFALLSLLCPSSSSSSHPSSASAPRRCTSQLFADGRRLPAQPASITHVAMVPSAN
ncbi:hypothetical protein CGCVW01_v004224 [Colletotrichum viniferum]|nr:hypothetical protein CGCVW01_v004224 [Colletotrichum viniferum]